MIARDAYAIAIIVLKVSSMKRPSHMLSCRVRLSAAVAKERRIRRVCKKKKK